MNPSSGQPVTPDDAAFLAAFETGEIANQSFHHRDHVRLAWVQIHRLGVEAAGDEVTRMIRRFATRHGGAARYNETMTRFWVRVVGIAVSRHPDLGFDPLIDAEPHLLDKSLPLRHWSREALFATDASATWVDPDLIPIPTR